MSETPKHLRIAANILSVLPSQFPAFGKILISNATLLHRHADATDCHESDELAIDLLLKWFEKVEIPEKLIWENSNYLKVSGWALDHDRSKSRRVKRVDVYKGAELVTSVGVLLDRIDVMEHFGDIRAKKSGFEFLIPRNSSSYIKYSCVAVLEDGSTGVITPESNFIKSIENENMQFSTAEDVDDTTSFGFLDNFHSEPSKIVQLKTRKSRCYQLFIESILEQKSDSLIELLAMIEDQRPLQHVLEGLIRTTSQPSISFIRSLAAVTSGTQKTALLDLMESDFVTESSYRPLQINRLEQEQFLELRPERSIEVCLPSLWIDRSGNGLKSTQLKVNKQGIYHLNNVDVVSSSTVISDEYLYMYDQGADSQYEFSAGVWDHVFTHPRNPEKALVKTSENCHISIDAAVLLSGRSDQNYFHSLIEYLPRIFLVKQDRRLDSLPLLISTLWPSSVMEALQTIAPEREILQISKDEMVHVGDLYIPSMHTRIFDSTRTPWIFGSRFSPDLIDEMRETLLEWASPFETQGEHVFLIRNSDARSLENSVEIQLIAREFGMTLVAPEKLSLKQQIGMFSTASRIVGVGGAAMANSVFSQKGNQILSMVSEQLRDFVIHSAIAKHAGADMTLLLGKTSAKPHLFSYRRDFLHAPFSISPHDFRGALTIFLE